MKAAARMFQTPQQKFVRALAEYLAGPNQVRQSIGLQIGDASAGEWAKIRSATPLSGYPTVDEAYNKLCEFLNVAK